MPQAWPEPFTHLVDHLPTGWRTRRLRLHNTQHGGNIETHHDVLCMLPAATAAAFNLPDHSTDHPGALVTSLDAPGLDPDTLWMQDLSARIPDAVTTAIETPTPFSAQVSRLVKYEADALPINGHPTYNPQGPAPSIMHYRPHEAFFGAPFAIWTGDQAWRATKACQPIRPHELWNLFGFNPTLADELTRAPPDMGL